MGQSIQVFAGNHVRFHDAETVVAILLLVDCATDSDLEISRDILWWQSSLDTWGPGCIQMDLDMLLDPQSRRAEFIELLDCALARLEAFEDRVPAPFINQGLGLRGPLERPAMPATLVEPVLRGLRRLVNGSEAD